uniref:Haloalkane dehalogenase 2 isoform X2 n=1 Tax=Rhizophora mucronata TaxID=61149 RepID=A0A2P2KCW0_RHIMU
MAIQAKTPLSVLHSHRFHSPIAPALSHLRTHLKPSAPNSRRTPLRLASRSNGRQDDYYLIDAPSSVGDGFSFSGGKYSDEPSPSDEWFKQGKIVKAHPVSSGEKAKDPIFGLKMGPGSQASDDFFRWFCVESGNADNPSVLLVHGFPSQFCHRHTLTAKFFPHSPRTIMPLLLIG